MKSLIIGLVFLLGNPTLCFSWPVDSFTTDQISRSIKTGDHYFICDTAIKEADDTLSIGIVVPAFSKPHVRFEISSSAGLEYNIYEGSSEFSAGTSLTAINNNRNSDKSPALNVIADPTFTSNGTLIYNQHAGAEKVAGASEQNDELILQAGENYLFEATSDAAANNISYCLEWYE